MAVLGNHVSKYLYGEFHYELWQRFLGIMTNIDLRILLPFQKSFLGYILIIQILTSLNLIVYFSVVTKFGDKILQIIHLMVLIMEMDSNVEYSRTLQVIEQLH